MCGEDRRAGKLGMPVHGRKRRGRGQAPRRHFFFSSRRWHTRWNCDWSSDVSSSDLGTLFPILSELVQGTKVTVGPPFFNQVNIPLGLALLALTGIGPLIAWRRASLPNLRRQFAVPATTGGLTLLVLLVGGMRDLYAPLAIALRGFLPATT